MNTATWASITQKNCLSLGARCRNCCIWRPKCTASRICKISQHCYTIVNNISVSYNCKLAAIGNKYHLFISCRTPRTAVRSGDRLHTQTNPSFEQLTKVRPLWAKDTCKTSSVWHSRTCVIKSSMNTNANKIPENWKNHRFRRINIFTWLHTIGVRSASLETCTRCSQVQTGKCSYLH